MFGNQQAQQVQQQPVQQAMGQAQTVAQNTGYASSELQNLVAQAIDAESQNRGQDGERGTFISLISPSSGRDFLDPNSPKFIQGAKPGDFVITKDKLLLGSNVDCTILGIFSVYAEMENAPVKNGQKQGYDKTVGFVPPSQAEQYPVEDGSFKRLLPNGHYLMPQNWVFVHLHDFKDVKNALVSYKSVGNRLCTELRKYVKANCQAITELRFSLRMKSVKNETYGSTNYYPEFVCVGKNYIVDEQGRAAVNPQANFAAGELEEIVKASSELNKSYAETRLVTYRNFTPVNYQGAQQAIAAPTEEVDDGVMF